MDHWKPLMYVPLAETGPRPCRLKKPFFIVKGTRADADLNTRTTLEEPEMEGVAESTRVLIVDDERTIADTLAAIFRIHGYDVQTAYSAEQAMETITKWHPHIALLDVMLPGMSGIDLAILLKNTYPWCQFLLFSGSSNTTRLLDEAKNQGHHLEVLAKPIHPVQILETVKLLLAAAASSRSLKRAN